MNGSVIYSRGFHLVNTSYRLPGGRTAAWPRRRSAVPVRYHFLDYSLSTYFPPGTYPKLVVGQRLGSTGILRRRVIRACQSGRLHRGQPLLPHVLRCKSITFLSSHDPHILLQKYSNTKFLVPLFFLRFGMTVKPGWTRGRFCSICALCSLLSLLSRESGGCV